ncbi:MAG: diacylglycerol kinase family protein [Candidatus Kuenenbacteria bacterium]
MYYYIYDTFINQKRYEKPLQKTEQLLANAGISGKIFKLNVLKNLEDIINQAENDNIKNIIAVGNDQTVSKVANLLVGKDLAVGIIPMGEQNNFALSFGINSAQEACEILSKRKIEEIDVGKVNNQYFLLSLESPTNDIIFDFEDYNISPLKENDLLGIYNIAPHQADFKSNPKDGIMEAVFSPAQSSWWSAIFGGKNKEAKNKSIFPIKKVVIKHSKKPVLLSIDRQRNIKTPVEVEVLKRKLKVIVGKERVF